MKKLTMFILVSILTMEIPPALGGEASMKDSKTSGMTRPFKTNYYAIIIGNDRYTYLPKLKTAVNDAEEMDKILREQYGFKTRLLRNARYAEIMTVIYDLPEKLSENDSLLIYYAGHGWYDKDGDKGYWQPIDAEEKNRAAWIISDAIITGIKRTAAKHVLIVSDSCFSGALTRGSAFKEPDRKGDSEKYLANMMKRRSRVLIASGGNEPVADAGGRSNHSVFAGAFITALKEADKRAFTATEFFTEQIKRIVAWNSDQVPRYEGINYAGHEGGDFIFQPLRQGSAEAAKAPETTHIPRDAKMESEDQAVLASRAASDAKTAPVSGTYTDPITGMEFVLVKGGCYEMGDTFRDGEKDEKPVHEVCLDDFYIGKFAVTQGQWRTIMGNNPSKFGNCGDDCPVERVSWYDVQKFTGELNQRSGKDYRLPTEAEWEYAARSGGKREKWAGTSNESELDEYAWYISNSEGRTTRVGRRKPNGLGLYDMSGLVWQWTADWYGEEYYGESPGKNPKGPSSGEYRVVRGGAWYNEAWYLRATYRDWVPPDRANHSYGFRLVMPVR